MAHFAYISAASTNATVVNKRHTKLRQIIAFNSASSARSIKFYSAGTTPTVGTDAVFRRVTVPANGGVVIPIPDKAPWDFPVGIQFAITTGMADSDTTATGANEVTLGLDYE